MILSAILVVALTEASTPGDAGSIWTKVCADVEYAEFTACTASPQSDSRISVVRIDPAQARLRALSAAHLGLPRPLRADAWSEQFDLAVVINAGMFGADGRHVGYLKIDDGRVDNPTILKDYKSALAFGAREPGRPEAVVVDLERTSISDSTSQYRTVVQNLRMIRSPGRVVWSRSTRKWSEAALGMDKSGRILFIFCRSPHAMFEFSHCLLDLPLGLVTAQHLEGGGLAALVIRTPRMHMVRFGGYETTREGRETEQGDQGGSLPIVLGIGACREW